MYYAFASFPDADTRGIERLRRRYDPTVDLIEPHLPLVFPVPGSIGRSRLVRHVEEVLRGWRPFPVVARGLSKSPDHWLFLTLSRGRDRATELYRELYRGPLAEYGRPDLFEPHIGLGHFLKAGRRYDWDHPERADLDSERYAKAVEEAEKLDLELACVVDRLELMELPDEVMDWTQGKRAACPTAVRAVRCEPLRLGGASDA